MSKAVLISTHPKWCNRIANGYQTIVIKKTRPKIKTPFKCYIYCTEPNTKNPWKLLEIHSSDGKIHKGNGKVIGEFICDEIFPISFYASDVSFFDTEPPFTVPGTCLTDKEIAEYLGNGKTGYGWHISDLKIYDEPKELSEFRTICKYGDDYPCHICNKAKRDSRHILYCNNTLKRPPQSWCYVEK